jgi:hypothetical protein
LSRGLVPDWLPPELVEFVDLDDPDIYHVCISLACLRRAGMNIMDPNVFRMGVELGHKKAAEVPDDRSLQPRREAELTQQQASLAAAQRRPAVKSRVCVYYMRMGNRCKIGFTGNIASRVRAINPEELLVTEPGGFELEQQRHAQFSDLRTHGEWFRYEGALVDHVMALKGSVAA